MFNKFITGGFRIGISKKLMTRALSAATGVAEELLAYRLMGNWDPQSVSFEQLVLEEREADKASRPFPFFLAHALEGQPSGLGAADQWLAEHKWDGIRAVVRTDAPEIRLRSGTDATRRYPELAVLAAIAAARENVFFLPGYPLPDALRYDADDAIHRTTVAAHLNRHGVPRHYEATAWNGENLRQAAEQYATGSSLADVADQFGIDAQTVANRFRRAGVVVRPRSGRPSAPA